MKITIKRAVVTGVIVTGLALGGTGVAMAATTSTANPGTGTGTATEEQDPTYVGSVTAPKEAGEDTGTAEGTGSEGSGSEGADSTTAEADESKALQPLATVTADEATAAALAAVPGTAGSAELENENGYVVYGVEITATDGTVTDVKVDAGNGKVLAQDTESDTETNDD